MGLILVAILVFVLATPPAVIISAVIIYTERKRAGL